MITEVLQTRQKALPTSQFRTFILLNLTSRLAVIPDKTGHRVLDLSPNNQSSLLLRLSVPSRLQDMPSHLDTHSDIHLVTCASMLLHFNQCIHAAVLSVLHRCDTWSACRHAYVQSNRGMISANSVLPVPQLVRFSPCTYCKSPRTALKSTATRETCQCKGPQRHDCSK